MSYCLLTAHPTIAESHADPLPSWVWYQDMADFAGAITDERTGRRLLRALR